MKKHWTVIVGTLTDPMGTVKTVGLLDRAAMYASCLAASFLHTGCIPPPFLPVRRAVVRSLPTIQ